VVSDLGSVIERVQNSLRLIEQAIVRNRRSAPESSTNVIVLDDLSPARSALMHRLFGF
jgi:hypothetical protein